MVDRGAARARRQAGPAAGDGRADATSSASRCGSRVSPPAMTISPAAGPGPMRCCAGSRPPSASRRAPARRSMRARSRTQLFPAALSPSTTPSARPGRKPRSGAGPAARLARNDAEITPWTVVPSSPAPVPSACSAASPRGWPSPGPRPTKRFVFIIQRGAADGLGIVGAGRRPGVRGRARRPRRRCRERARSSTRCSRCTPR